MDSTQSRTVLIDSLLHSNIKRVILGAICGVAAGMVLLALTTLFTPEGANKIWWLQLLSTAFYSGDALEFAVPGNVLAVGAIVHFGFCTLLGLIFGKMTTSRNALHLLPYGLVLGGFFWLFSNLFAPDFINIAGLATLGEWMRMFLFQSFTLSLAIFMGLSSSVLKA